eukprot:TRINITY_DN3428_c0_g3_i1.p1 TRINITY_DN3428_c0_g3~~TRINITY_DN3428_c0_g3_i1.p1  ORF type:complete len:225 (+),score=31.09 TRINITY_DN3428_c0_g3_i1:3767-4441(+)
MPSIWLTNETGSEYEEERKQLLLSTGFVRFMNVHKEKNLQILPSEGVKVLKNVVKEYPYSIITYVLATGEFYLLRICSDLPSLQVLSHEDLEDVDNEWSRKDILKQRAFTMEDISLHLNNTEEEGWYTIYYSSQMVIQAGEVIGSGTVEKLKKDRAPLQIVLPSSLGEITAIGLQHPQVLEEAQKISPVDPAPGSFERQPSSLTERPSTATSDCSSEKTKAEDT